MTTVFEEMGSMGHESVIFCRNEDVGLKAIIAVHNTTLGPGLGGCRLYDYKSEEDALYDVLRLSRGMTYKAAITGLDLGGGKAVIIGDPSIKSEALFRAFGRHVEAVGGRYITAEDMNTNVEDMNYIRRETLYVTGAGAHVGGSGDPAPVTAWGVYHGIRACLEVTTGNSDVRGRSIAIQGVGNVGYRLAGYLHENGAKLIYSDINRRNIDRAMAEYGGQVVEADEFFGVECDVLAPCAIGGIINERTIPMIRAPILAGAANNILAVEMQDAQLLRDRGIVYAPDYVINAGGLINVDCERMGWSHEKAMDDTASIFDTVKKVLNKAEADNVSTILASNRIAEERIENVAKLKRLHVGAHVSTKQF